MTTTNDVDRTEWSLPVQGDVPRDTLQTQLEVYGETILLRGFEADRTWVRTVSADEIANVFTRHLGFSSGLLPEERPLVEPGRNRPGGGAVAPAPGVAGGIATGGVPASRPAAAAHAGVGIRLLAGPGALGLRRPGTARQPRAAALPAPRPSTSSGTEGSAPAATASPNRWDGYPNPSSSPSSPLPETARAGRSSTPTTCKPCGRRLDGKAEYPVEDLVPQCTVGHAMAVSEGRRGY